MAAVQRVRYDELLRQGIRDLSLVVALACNFLDRLERARVFIKSYRRVPPRGDRSQIFPFVFQYLSPLRIHVVLRRSPPFYPNVRFYALGGRRLPSRALLVGGPPP